MSRYQGWFAFVLALAIAAGMFLVRTPLQLGLDLRGGSQLTVELRPAGDITVVGDQELEAVKAVLDRRVNGLGVAESTLQTVGGNQLVLQLPGEQDPTAAARILGDTALLEFRAQSPETEVNFRSLRQLQSQANAILNCVRTSAAEVKRLSRSISKASQKPLRSLASPSRQVMGMRS